MNDAVADLSLKGQPRFSRTLRVAILLLLAVGAMNLVWSWRTAKKVSNLREDVLFDSQIDATRDSALAGELSDLRKLAIVKWQIDATKDTLLENQRQLDLFKQLEYNRTILRLNRLVDSGELLPSEAAEQAFRALRDLCEALMLQTTKFMPQGDPPSPLVVLCRTLDQYSR